MGISFSFSTAAASQAAASDVVYNSPATAAVARFLNCYNLFAGTVAEDAFVGPAGRFP